MTTNDVLLELSTAVVPGFPFRVDGETYELRTMASLSKVEEARLHVLNKREQAALQKLERADPLRDVQHIERLSDELRGIRIDLITLMTNLPHEIAENLSVMGQMKVIEYIGKEPEAIEKERAERESPFDTGRSSASGTDSASTS